MWALSLVGRAPALHAGGQGFDSPRVQIWIKLLKEFNFFWFEKILEERCFFMACNVMEVVRVKLLRSPWLKYEAALLASLLID